MVGVADAYNTLTIDGIHGIFMHDNADGGKYVKIGYHEGLIEPEMWLRVQDKIKLYNIEKQVFEDIEMHVNELEIARKRTCEYPQSA